MRCNPTMSLNKFVLLIVAIHAVLAVLPAEAFHTQTLTVDQSRRKRTYDNPLSDIGPLYTTNIDLGGELFRVAIDTGSNILYVTSTYCRLNAVNNPPCTFAQSYYDGDGTAVAYFANCARSGVYKGQSGNCILTSSYGDGSYVEANALRDVVTLGPYSATATFGSIFNASSDYLVTGMDGLWGLGRYVPNYLNIIPSPLDALAANGMPNVFAVCLTDVGGELHLGGYYSSYGDTSIHWFPMVGTFTYYEMTVSKIYVGESVASATPFNVVLDTGSTISYLTPTLFASFKTQVISYCESACPSLACAEFVCDGQIWDGVYTEIPDLAAFPTVRLNLMTNASVSVNLTLEPSDYLQPYPGFPDFYALGITESSINLFGISVLETWYTVFDRQVNRIGISELKPATCDGALPAINPGDIQTVPLAPVVPLSPPINEPVDAPSGSNSAVQISLGLVALLLALVALYI